MEKINYDGHVFGRLTVLKDGQGIYEGKKKRRSVICICSCGVEKDIILRRLIKQEIKSCGCLKKEQKKEITLAEKTNSGSDWVSRLKGNMKSNLKNKPITKVEIKTKDIIEKYYEQEKLSYFLKLPFDLTMGDSLLSISVDRIDNSIGYAKDNFNLVTRFENMGRNKSSYEEMKNFSDKNFIIQKSLITHPS